ncbi:Tetraspanin family-domain-containing protein [Dichotomocladium elegans]|nr:Tetraspanin family-domain-containing protein [Dichotomocladium elegans]
MAATCCARLSKVYMVTTNLLFACLGVAYVAFGVIGMRHGFKGATLFPEMIFKLIAILGAIIAGASLLGILGAYKKRRSIIFIYMIIVLIALVFQVVIGVKVYQKAANTPAYLGPLWSQGSTSYRMQLQSEFSCCGYNNPMDKPAVTDVCDPSSGTISKYPACYDTLNRYADTAFKRLYAVLFAALAVEFLALTNGITVLCTRAMVNDQEEEGERRKRRKSGIRLDDMSSPDTPTTAGSHNHYGMSHADANRYYSSSYKEDSYDISPAGTAAEPVRG